MSVTVHRIRGLRIGLSFGISVLVTAASLLWMGTTAYADGTGPCNVLGIQSVKPLNVGDLEQGKTPSGAVTTDLTSSQSWNVDNNRYLALGESTTVTQHKPSADVYFFGISFPFASANASGKSFGGAISTSDFVLFTRTFGVTLASDLCSGRFAVLVNSVSPFATVIGGGGVVLSVIGFIGLTMVVLRRRGGKRGRGNPRSLRRRLGAVGIGIVAGVVAGIGEGLYLQEAGTFSPFDRRVLILPAAGAFIGLLCGLLGGFRRRGEDFSKRPEVTVLPGLAGRFRVWARLGGGATGDVWGATELKPRRPVAIKQLAQRLAAAAGFVDRFRAEATVLRKLDSPHCVRFYDLIEADGNDYLVTERVDGASLRAVLRRSHSLTPEQSLGVLEGALKGLDRAHHLGLVHRDIKPDNVLVNREGVSKLIDFGLTVPAYGSGGGAAERGTGAADNPTSAPASGELAGPPDESQPTGKPIGAPPSMTSEGTPAYMSPEQIRGSAIDARSDIYSAGAMLYELLTGKVPFVAPTADAMMQRAVQDPVPDPRVVNSAIPQPVATMVMHALAKDPASRQPNAKEFLVELKGAAQSGYGKRWRRRASMATLAAGAIGGGVGAINVSRGAAGVSNAGGAPHEIEVAGATADTTTPGGVAGAMAASGSSAAIATAAASIKTASAGSSGSGIAAGVSAHALPVAVHGLERVALLPVKLLAGVAVGVAAAAGGSAAHVVATSATADVITPTQAQLLFKEAWQTTVSAFATGKYAEVNGLFASDMLPLVQVIAQEPAGNRSNIVGADLTSPAVYVRHQVTYPADFLAVATVNLKPNTGTGSATAMRLYAVFARQSASAAWQITFLSAVDESAALPRFKSGGDGYVTSVSPSTVSRLTVLPSALSSTYAAYIDDHIAGVASPVDKFASGNATTGFISSIKAYIDGWNNSCMNGKCPFTASDRLNALSQPPSYVYSAADGSVLAVFAVDQEERFATKSGGCADGNVYFTQPGGPIPGGQLTEGLVNANDYIVATDPPATAASGSTGAKPQVSILGSYFYLVSARGTPCPP